MATNVQERDFEHAVLKRSRELPVVVDFWAAWCGPCRTLGPALERAAAERAGKLELVKVDVDANPGLSQRYGIRGIPAVKAFRNGEVVAEFVGAQPAAEVERFLESIVPSEADSLAAEGDEQSLRRALELDPRHAGAAAALARLLLERGEAAQALALLEPLPPEPVADGLAARARLELSGDGARDPGLAAALGALGRGETEQALERLAQSIDEAGAGDELRGLIRQVMVGVFAELGTDHPLASAYRRRLAAALF